MAYGSTPYRRTPDDDFVDGADYDHDHDIDIDVCVGCGAYFDFGAALKRRGEKVENAAQHCDRCHAK